MKIIAYGSLQNRQSLEATLGRSVTYGRTKVIGYEKVFNAPFGNYAFLNLRKNTSASFTCVYFTIQPGELCKFKDREAGSVLAEIMPDFWAFVWPESYCRALPVLQSYIDVCEKGYAQNTLDFWRSTVTPKTFVNDRKQPIYSVT